MKQESRTAGECHRIALIDSDPLALKCLVDFVKSSQARITVAATFRDGADAIAELTLCHDVSPSDVSYSGVIVDGIILDMSLIGTTSPLICRHLRRRDAITPILGMAKARVDHYMTVLALCGGQGLVSKDEPEPIVAAMESLMSGTPTAFPGFEDAATAHTRLVMNAATRAPLPSRVEELAAVITGSNLSPQEAATMLHIAPSTARGYLKRIRDYYHTDSTMSALCLWADDNTADLR